MTMSQDTFVQHLRGVNEIEPPGGDGRNAAIHRRIRRVRQRRAVVGGIAAAVVAIAGTAFVAIAGPSLTQTAAERATPKSWVAQDGVVYRRVAATIMVMPEQKRLVITVPDTSAPIAILATCSASDKGDDPASDEATLGIAIGGENPDSKEIQCFQARKPTLFDFDTSSVTRQNGRLTLTLTDDRVYLPDPSLTPYDSRWTLGVYVWDVPAKLRPAPTLPALPQHLDGYTLHATYTGTWPPRHAVTFIVPKGTTWNILPVCSGAFIGAHGEDFSDFFVASGFPNGAAISYAGSGLTGEPCLGLANAVTDSVIEGNRPKSDLTVTVTISFDKIYDQRSGSWELGIYYQQ